jgi:molecular chaperone DnaK (HSP70)
MARPRFSIGIDLGTTNCALAFVSLDDEARSEIFGIPQWDTLSAIAESRALPSFLYLPDEAAAALVQTGKAGNEEWVVGRLARKKAVESPGRVVHSAKSWLCYHTSDRSARFLPWGSGDIARNSKISPVCASALILNHLKRTWNTRFAEAGAEFEFDRQEITVAVPASFDAAAQRLTLTAALEAGFPETIHLLEEPQAAFYCWLEQHDIVTDLESKLPNDTDGTYRVLVVDIGGGTSDFSLFEFRSDRRGAAPKIKREAVGDHILLGGDNVDLAVAHLLEPRLVGERGKLSGTQWDDLVARCRDLKEKMLSSAGELDERFAVSLPGRGAGLVASSHTARLTRAELWALLLDGFFPECDPQARPYRPQAALKEWGLPYASDCAITRHLADFLRGRPRIDAILFNGGSLHPELLRQRICQLVGKWQGGVPLVALENADPDLAVARGAALFGKFLHHNTECIEADAARAVFLEVLKEQSREPAQSAGRSLVCVLPRGASSEQRFDITGLPLEVHTNRPTRFQAYYSTRDDRSKAGDIVDWSEREFNALPPLVTVIKVADSATDITTNTLPVTLTASANELGLLQVSCVSADERIKQSWPLEFDLRPQEQDSKSALRSAAVSSASIHTEPNVSADALEAARNRIQALFTRSLKQRETLTAARLLRNLEQILGMPKSEWNAALVRALWPALESCMELRKQSVAHEEAWLILAGFLLRPGFGVAADNFRIDSLWRLRDHGLYFLGKRIKSQEYILWRRVAGGLPQERQEQILAPELEAIRTRKKLAPELIRLAGSLERVPKETKTELADLFIDIASDLIRDNKHCAPYLGALEHLLSRAPLYAGPETVLAPDVVERAYESFQTFDWTAPELAAMQTLFLRAARVVGSRSFDLPKALRHQIATKLENSGVAPQKTGKLKDFIPLGISERISLHDESLPPGLILTES